MRFLFPLIVSLLISACGGGQDQSLDKIQDESLEIGAGLPGPALPDGFKRVLAASLIHRDDRGVVVIHGSRNQVGEAVEPFNGYIVNLVGQGSWDIESIPEHCRFPEGETEQKFIECSSPFASTQTLFADTFFVHAGSFDNVAVDIAYISIQTDEPPWEVSSHYSNTGGEFSQRLPKLFDSQFNNIWLYNPEPGIVYAELDGFIGNIPAGLSGAQGYSAVITGDAQWNAGFLPADCALDESDQDNRTITCLPPPGNSEYELAEGVRSFKHILPIVPANDSTLSVTFSFPANDWNFPTDPLVVTESIAYQANPQPRFDLGTGEVWADLQRGYFLNQSKSLQFPFGVLQSAPMVLSGKIEVAVSSGYEISSFGSITTGPTRHWLDADRALGLNPFFEIPPDELPDCTLAEKLVCEFDSNPYYALHMLLTIEALSDTDGFLDISIFSGSNGNYDPLPSLNERFTLVNAGPMSVLQNLIATAPEGSTVELPPGRFGGALYVPSGGNVSIQGASGDEPTILLGGFSDPVINNLQPRTSLSNMVLRSYGRAVLGSYGSNVTLENNVIEPAERYVGFTLRGVHGVLATRDGKALRLRGNTIRNWGNAENGECFSLVSASHGEMYLQHNVFESNNCDALIYASTPTNLMVENNTFVHNNSLLTIASLPSKLTFRNNIVYGTRPLFNYKTAENSVAGEVTLIEAIEQAMEWADSYNQPSEDNPAGDASGDRVYWPYHQPWWLSISNNILWNSDGSEFADSALRDMPGVADANDTLIAAPGFVNAESGDYRLGVSSPAIDAGTAQTEYQWFRSQIYSCLYTSCLGYPDEAWIWDIPGAPPYPQPTPDQMNQPVDGNGDGTSEFDIGAFEFIPGG